MEKWSDSKLGVGTVPITSYTIYDINSSPIKWVIVSNTWAQSVTAPAVPFTFPDRIDLRTGTDMTIEDSTDSAESAESLDDLSGSPSCSPSVPSVRWKQKLLKLFKRVLLNNR
jgi:hypothetical protein